MPDPNLPPEPVAEPTIEEVLLGRLDSYVREFEQQLELLGRVVEQLDPERAAMCAEAIGMARIALDELHLRARGEEGGQ